MDRATAVKRAGTWQGSAQALVLAHDERHVRRRLVSVPDGPDMLVDLPVAMVLEAGDALVLESGAHVAIEAAVEPLLEVRGTDPVHLATLAWHIGNRHLAAAIDEARILILRDHVIRAMLEGLGATVRDVEEPFAPVRGAYSGHTGHTHAHAHPHTGAA